MNIIIFDKLLINTIMYMVYYGTSQLQISNIENANTDNSKINNNITKRETYIKSIKKSNSISSYDSNNSK